MMNRVRERTVSLMLAALMLLALVPTVAIPQAHADATVVEVGTFDDLLSCVRQSQTDSFEGRNIVLTADLDLTGANMDGAIQELGHLSFGSSSVPFKGSFDGRGHTITGLDYNRSLFVPAADTGLFAQTQGATIENLVMRDAYVGADFRGGVLVGLAQDTRIENVTLVNCTSSVTPANNAISLITNAGLAGGVLAGEVSNSVLYNCEVRGGGAINTSTAGITALGGEGLYLGALVGTASGSTIEYCRVAPVVDGQSGSVAHTRVSNKYDIAVGAVSGQAVYAGGIVGQMAAGTQVLDCFSTADCYTYCATYVSVGAGNVGYVGGVAAAAYGSSCAIARTHYAGNLHSQQYNAVLVIPVIQKNVNLAGIVEKVGESVSVTDSYYQPTASNEAGVTKKITAVGSSASGASYGPLPDERYRDRTFWEAHDFDLAGGTTRSTAYDASHIDKWVMDLNLGMPVHGSSMKAGLDFPGAGSVSIGASGLSPEAQATADPSAFAVEGFLPADASLAFAATTNEKDPAFAGSAANGGYRLDGWYRAGGVDVNYASPGSGFYAAIVAQGDLVGTAPALSAPAVDNDLLVAHYQAQALFHDVEGNPIDKASGAASADASDDWYDYAATLPSVPAPANTGSGASHVSATATLVGWASTPYAGTAGGWPAVTSTELADLKASGAFFVAGDVVRRPLDLYPVYADYSSNIVTVFEGNEQDADERTSMRDGVGSTSVTTGTDPDGVPTYAVSVSGTGTDGAFPDGYRFLGWYEQRDGVDVRISREPTYTLPADVDLAQQHTYTARFEYRVQYWTKAQYQDAGNYNEASSVYASRWERYDAPFASIAGPAFMLESFGYWTAESHAHAGAYASAIVAPVDVFSHDTYEGSGSKTNFSAYIATDFPGGSTIAQKSTTLGSLTSVSVAPLPGINFVCWTGESDAALAYKHDVADTPEYKVGTIYSTYNYAFIARLTADVTFHQKAGATSTVTRQYDEPVFLEAAAVHPYSFVYHSDATGASTTSGASPTDASMQAAGYRFLGWMDKDSIAAGSMTQTEWDYVFDVADDASCTSDPARALPYVLDGSAAVTRAMDLHPVYARYDIETTTNVSRAGVSAGSGIAVPPDPSFTTVDNGDGTLSATVTADVNTPVTSGSTTLYELVSLTLERSDGTTATLSPTTAGGNVFTSVVAPGPRYTFVANYTPLAVAYHLDTAQTDVRLKNTGDLLGPGPQPLFDLATVDAAAGGVHAFAGWTSTDPGADGYAIGNAGTVLAAASDPVVQPLELWPVYRPTAVTVQSNIDAALTAGGIDPASVRSIARAESGGIEVRAGDGAGYQFVGWYTGYADAANPGTLASSAPTFALDTAQAFDPVTYTAVYEAVHELRYHDTHGAVLDTVGVRDDEPRSFVEMVEVPVYDGDGNQTGTKQVESIIDSTAYQDIVRQLDSECQQAPQRETFSAWQWVKADGTAVAWDDFYRTSVSEDMDLYPVTWRCAALDANGASYTPNLTWQIDFNAAASGDAATPVQAYLREPYVQSSLWVTVDQAAYGAGGTFDTVPQQNVAVALYNSVDASADKIGQESTSADGIATFAFTGSLTLKKTCASGAASGRTFALSVTGSSTSGGTGVIGEDTRTVLLTCRQLDDGSVGDSVTISLPYGEYTVAEDTAWAWRSSPMFSVLDLGATTAREDTKVTVSSSGATVTCTNTNSNDRWTDGDDRRTNVFG